MNKLRSLTSSSSSVSQIPSCRPKVIRTGTRILWAMARRSDGQVAPSPSLTAGPSCRGRVSRLIVVGG